MKHKMLIITPIGVEGPVSDKLVSMVHNKMIITNDSINVNRAVGIRHSIKQSTCLIDVFLVISNKTLEC